MPFDYLPVLARAAAPKPPRVLVAPSAMAWRALRKPLTAARVALLTSAALRLRDQPPFSSDEDDLSYRLIPSDPGAGELVLDHRSRIGATPRRDPEIVFPRSALAVLAANGKVGSIAPVHISIMGGTRRHDELRSQLASAIARELGRHAVDLAVLVPY